MTLTEAVSHLPVGFVLRMERETADSGLHACIYQHAPGWEPGDVFDGDDPNSGWRDCHPASRFRDRTVFCITADSVTALERLTIGAILCRWPHPPKEI